MGCGDSAQDRSAPSIEQLFLEFKLDNLITGTFENDLERKIFQAVNVCRYNPKLFIPRINQMKKHNPVAKNTNHTHLLIQTLKNKMRLPPIRMDDPCFIAVRDNNAKIVDLNEEAPTMGGNIVMYN